MSKQTYTVNQFIDIFNVGRTTTYKEIETGRLKTYKVGRRRYISAHAAADWQRRLEAESNPDSGGANVTSLHISNLSCALATTAVPATTPSDDAPVPQSRRPDAKHPGRPRKMAQAVEAS